MSPEKSYVAAVLNLLAQAGAKGAQMQSNVTAERGVVELVTPEGLIATTTVRMRGVPVSDAGQLALPMMGGPKPAAAPPVAPDADELVELVGPPGWVPGADVEILNVGMLAPWTWRDEPAEILRTVVPADVADRVCDALERTGLALERHPPSAPSHLVRVGDMVSHYPVEGGASAPLGRAPVLGFVEGTDATLPAGVVLRVGNVPRVAWCDTINVVGDELVFRLCGDRWECEPAEGGFWCVSLVTPAKRKASRPAPKTKGAPGSKGNPHRGTAVPEADALAVQGTLIAVALQPDGHWKLWASNPEKPGGALLTSPEWKKRWHGARRADLRVRLYNRARRCTHDSLDGDHDGGES